MPGWSVRPSTADDAAGITRVRIDGWRTAYGRLIPSSYLERMEERRETEVASRRERFGLDAEQTEWVGVLGGEVVGWASAGRSRDPDAPVPRELFALYTDPPVHGSGLAAALVRAVLGDAPASLWVLEDNPRARAFYSRQGFVADGSRKMLDGELSHLPEIRMVRLL